MFPLPSMPSTTSVLSTYTTFTASVMLVRSVFNVVQAMTNQVIPQPLQEKILSKLAGLLSNLSSQMTLIIEEKVGLNINQVYEASQIYLRTRISPSVQRLKVSMAPKEEDFSVTITRGEKIVDTYEGIQFVWEMICTESQKMSFNRANSISTEKVEQRSFELSFDKKYKEKVLSSYLPYVLERSKAIKEATRTVKIYSLGDHGGRGSINLAHPSTFDTLAMDATLKEEVIDDLNKFVRRRKFYRRVGKAWKRGYLLYGPPGTGKSSLVAAMANHLKFDIYDLELTSMMSNSDLKRLLFSTTNRSILVIEDIDCSVKLQNRLEGGSNQTGSQLTLSGLLNFIDGLWSGCGDERIIVFTTNHKDRLDPALLRPGRMDMHIHMSYCTFSGFKTLASNYLGITNHNMFPEIEKLVAEVEVTPAEIAEELMKSDEEDIALEGLTQFLKRKRTERNQANDEGKENEEIKKSDEKKVMNNKRKAKRTKRRSPRF